MFRITYKFRQAAYRFIYRSLRLRDDRKNFSSQTEYLRVWPDILSEKVHLNFYGMFVFLKVFIFTWKTKKQQNKQTLYPLKFFFLGGGGKLVAFSSLCFFHFDFETKISSPWQFLPCDFISTYVYPSLFIIWKRLIPTSFHSLLYK